jgi:uncharacterized protein (TIGR03435 family)
MKEMKRQAEGDAEGTDLDPANGGTAVPAALPVQADAPRASTPDGPPSLSVAIEQQLGLKFEPRKGPFYVLVVDRVERVPKEN